MLETVYFVSMLLFGFILTASLIVGELAEWFGHLGESVVGALESGLSALPFIDHIDLGGHFESDHFSGFGVTRSLMTFATVFSGTGFLSVRYFKVSEPVSALLGLLFGTAAGMLTFVLLRFLLSQNSEDVPTLQHYVGKIGVLIVPIGENGIGVVMFSGGNAGNITMPAISDKKLERGARVEITAISGANAYVKLLINLDSPNS